MNMKNKKDEIKLVRESNRLYTVDNCLISNAIILHDTVYCLSNENPEQRIPCGLCALSSAYSGKPCYKLCDYLGAKEDEYFREIGELFHPF